MSESSTSLRLALVDDQELFLESLGALLTNADPEVCVLWTARSGEEALQKARTALPDAVLMDYFFKGRTLDGAETTRLMLEEFPDLPVLVLSVSCELPVIREALQKGASGYASKEISKDELLRAVRAVARGDYFLDQVALREVVGSLQKKTPKTILTRRELEVARQYIKGRQIREIASALFISEDTVESHIKSIRSKTGASSRYEAAEYLRKHGLVEE